MKSKLAVLALVVSLASFAVSFSHRGGEATVAQAPVKESAYDRIMRTRTVRCAYIVWPPYLNRDANTGKLSGVYYDLLERMAKDWGMKVDWVEEVGAGNRFEGFATGRYDLVCAPSGGSPERTNAADFSRPFVYHPFFLYARADDNRFDNNYDAANDPSITMQSIDGYIGASIIKQKFPKAKLSSLPNLSTDSEVLLAIAMKKADASVCDSIMATDFIKNNSGKIKRVPGEPVRYSSETIPLPLNETQLRQKIDISLGYYLETGVIDGILNDNGLDSGKVLRVAKPYQ
jgi:ABC-type amino acid transport substrate-binding protein